MLYFLVSLATLPLPPPWGKRSLVKAKLKCEHRFDLFLIQTRFRVNSWSEFVDLFSKNVRSRQRNFASPTLGFYGHSKARIRGRTDGISLPISSFVSDGLRTEANFLIANAPTAARASAPMARPAIWPNECSPLTNTVLNTTLLWLFTSLHLSLHTFNCFET
jgi:hypothetical protein